MNIILNYSFSSIDFQMKWHVQHTYIAEPSYFLVSAYERFAPRALSYLVVVIDRSRYARVTIKRHREVIVAGAQSHFIAHLLAVYVISQHIYYTLSVDFHQQSALRLDSKFIKFN